MRRDATTAALGLAAAGSLAVYGLLFAMGPRYALSVPVSERPLLLVIVLYLLACAIYFATLPIAIRAPRSKLVVVVGAAIAFRLVLLGSPPYQEIDIYRYLWDGAVVAEGISPYAYPPERIVDGLGGFLSGDDSPALERLLEKVREQPALEEIVRTIHYGELTSPYPPVSQVVFAAAAITSPASWEAQSRLVWLKAWLTLFDVATLLAVIDLLRTCRMPLGWAIAYGWCPLVLKEIAGSGHLDSIAIGLATVALAMAARALRDPHRWRLGVGAAVLLGLGVGAKLYPVVLALLLAAALWRRLGWRVAGLGAVGFLVTVVLTLWPMFAASTPPPSVAQSEAESIAPPPGHGLEAETSGLSAFLSQWEMNDLLFMLVYENVRWRPDDAPREMTPWFDVSPEAWTEAWRDRDEEAFALTRAVTGCVFVLLAMRFAWRGCRHLDGSRESLHCWLRAAFLTLAWFWLLAPTQNPWYWCWAAPLLPWAGSRAWLAMSVFTLLYYLRFWLEVQFPNAGFLGFPYNGEFFFYYVVPWIEYAPVLAWLLYEAWATPQKDPLASVGGRTDPGVDAP